MALPSGNPFKSHEDVLSLQPMIPPKRFDIPPLCGMLRRSRSVHKERTRKQPAKDIVAINKKHKTQTKEQTKGNHIKSSSAGYAREAAL